MTRQSFRLLLVFYILASIAYCIAAVFSTLTFSPALAQAYANEPSTWVFINNPRLALSVAAIMLMLFVACVTGLFLFKPWGRSLALPLTVAGMITVLFMGPTLSSPAKQVFSELSTILWGAVLAAIYFSAVRDQFSRTAPQQNVPAMAHAAVRYQAENASSELEFGGSVSYRQFAAIQKALLPWWASWRTVVTALLVVFLILDDRPLASILSMEGALRILFLLAFASLAILAFNYISSRWNWRTVSRLSGTVWGRISERGIDWDTDLSSTQLPWKKFTHVKELPDMVLIHYSARCALYFPRHFFASDERWDEFKSIVANKLPGAPLKG